MRSNGYVHVGGRVTTPKLDTGEAVSIDTAWLRAPSVLNLGLHWFGLTCKYEDNKDRVRSVRSSRQMHQSKMPMRQHQCCALFINPAAVEHPTTISIDLAWASHRLFVNYSTCTS
jgi:hypothetical protein